MIIRSQNKHRITTDLDIWMEHREIGTKKEYWICNKTMIVLGRYSTADKAIKVLDMICNAYERHSLFSITYQDGMVSKLERCNGLNETRDLISPIFQMPSDEEVEV